MPTLQAKLKLLALSKFIKISSCKLQLPRFERHRLRSEQQLSSSKLHLSSSEQQ
jgi:hypothetical protein